MIRARAASIYIANPDRSGTQAGRRLCEHIFSATRSGNRRTACAKNAVLPARRNTARPMSQQDASTLAASTSALVRGGLVLEYLTLGWNVIGTVLLFSAAIAAGSVALAGFGLDSAIEIVASLVVVWQLTGAPGERDHRAMRVIAVAFAALAVTSPSSRRERWRPGRTPYIRSRYGMGWRDGRRHAATAGCQARHRHRPRERRAQVGGRVTLVDAYLAASVLAGLLLSAALGWWWADPVAALVIVGYAIRESRHASPSSRCKAEDCPSRVVSKARPRTQRHRAAQKRDRAARRRGRVRQAPPVSGEHLEDPPAVRPVRSLDRASGRDLRVGPRLLPLPDRL